MIWKVCLLIGGLAPSRELLGSRLEKCSIIVAADSGLSHAAELGLAPTDIVGDFDSVEKELMHTFPQITMHSYSTEKDETDTELGIELLRERGAGNDPYSRRRGRAARSSLRSPLSFSST